MKNLFTTSVMLGCIIFYTTAQVINIPDDKPTIQAGIDSASTGDTVLVQEGTWCENINFKGKAITVASLFIMDGDTSHISKTIIDGSQASDPDSASTVTMRSGEDTTSVLMGFTITGGKGTSYYDPEFSRKETGGGGIFILGSGGKIVRNVVTGNHIEDPEENVQHVLRGGGIFGYVYHNHTMVIRENKIRINGLTGWSNLGGGGLAVSGGRILCENNEITNNTITAQGGVFGGGMMGCFFDTEGVIKDAIIRNNLISGNKAITHGLWWGGGGYSQHFSYGEGNVHVYNNIIIDNYSNYLAGGVLFVDGPKGRFFNNTIINNSSGYNGKSMFISHEPRIAVYNNIIGSFINDSVVDIEYYHVGQNVRLFHNLLKEPIKAAYDVTNESLEYMTKINNKIGQPVFQRGTYELAENSPGIGWGLDSMLVDGTWYYTSPLDYYNNQRPDPVDQYVDFGAIESAFPRIVNNADLSYIGLWDRILWPPFDKDTLQYVLPVPDTTVVTPQIDVVTEDWLAEVDINNAENIGSPEPADRTTTIIVTAADGMTQKTYTVLFRYASKDPTLSYLSISKGTLMPEFQTDSLIYTVCLPKDQTTPPEVYFETNDPMATVSVEYASNIQLQTPWPQYRPYRTTVITVTSEDGIYPAKYEIEHLLDKNVPFIRLTTDTVILNSNIEATSTEDGYICLVPVNTPKNTDSVMIHLIDSIGVGSQVAAYLTASDTGTYWLYAIDHCLNISSSVKVTIIEDTTGIHENTHENMLSNIRLYPIPVDRTLFIETSETITSVELFNVIGVKVMDQSKFEGWIDMGHLEQGVYFIRIRTERGDVYSGKVVKR